MIRLEKYTVHRGGFSLNSISMDIAAGEYGVLMGPTGCGKTTLLESICGLHRNESGRIHLAGIDVTSVAAAERQIGYVPQQSTLFPMMRVDRQIGFGLRVRNVSRRDQTERVNELAKLLEIEQLLRRFPNGLSGGERQRVALARALAFRPRLLCLDEPMSALDADTRERMTDLLQSIFEKEKLTVLHVTHNSSEAERLATVRLVLESGAVRRC